MFGTAYYGLSFYGRTYFGSGQIQVFIFRFFNGTLVRELSFVVEASAPTGMGGVVKMRVGGATRAAELVETTNPNASAVRIRTTTGTKAVRLKT